MRSDLIYAALAPVQNRYTVCQLASKATRKFHRPNTRIQETMNEVLARFGRVEGADHLMSRPARSEKFAEAHRKAA